MRSRSNSGVRLDYYQRIVYRTILDHQNPVTGLLPTNHYHHQSDDRTASGQHTDDHAWVRDNVYSILSVWSLSMAYKKNTDLDEDRAKTYELEQSCVKLMRGLLMAMIRQKDKLEAFKESQSVGDSLHAKYSSDTMLTVVGDHEWGHLQLDATSLFLLILAQMTASGLQIIFNLDEVAFVQNLVFYIESAYCIPDYGIWERGDKTNHGLPELNASSIGMAKAALEAMNELDLFGGRGGPSSVIHVLADEAQKCHAVLQSMLPRESNSKEVDGALLSVIGFPAFALEDKELIKMTRNNIVQKLQGRYGCRRFLRDGFRTAKEDPTRLYYEPSELKVFENIECEWPLFFCYLILDGLFNGDREMVDEYSEALEQLLVKTEDGLKLVPEMYAVPGHLVEQEYQQPHSQERYAIGSCPFMWAQSLYIVGRLLQEGFIAPGELDPLNRRLGAEKKPDVVVQVVILAEDTKVQEKLVQHDIHIKTVDEVAPIEVQAARLLSHLYAYLGYNRKMNLSGRQSREVGLLSTSKLYSLQDKIFAFTPQFVDEHRYYIASDTNLMLDTFKSEIAFLKVNWRMLGRPTVVIPLSSRILGENDRIPVSMISTIKKLKSGYLNGTRVVLGSLDDFLSTSCITSLSFLSNTEEGDPEGLNDTVKEFLERELKKPFVRKISRQISAKRKISIRSRKSGVSGIIKRTRSIQVDQYDPDSKASQQQQQQQQQTGGVIQSGAQSSSSTSPSSPRHMSVAGSGFGSISETNNNNNNTDDDMFDAQQNIMMSSSISIPIRPAEKRLRGMSELHINEDIKDDELLTMYRESEQLEEQADIIHYLFYNKGLGWETGLGGSDKPAKVRDLLKELYEKACSERKWALVRHSAGMLGKQVEDLAKSVADLLVRQKQITVGQPPHYEQAIIRPLPAKELRQIIDQTHGGDQSTAMLTQELLIYLAMFIRTEPQLFHEMLRLRVGLIIQVMASELARALKCDGEEASEHLLNLSPYEMKTLLHHILSGKEFTIKSARSGRISIMNDRMLSRKSFVDSIQPTGAGENSCSSVTADEYGFEGDRQGQWLRRRRLDGSLNRVPIGFYTRVWSLLEKCHGIAIEGRILMQQLTREMTSEELKFALQVESVLNCVPQPEYRQLMVEALMVLTLLVEHHCLKSLTGIINIEQLVHRANQVFLEDQRAVNGDATLCCACNANQRIAHCCGAANICQHFYDSAPSGNYGTMTYLIRAVTATLDSETVESINFS
ncbi:probable phosphorylase b kinase regulatory subunit alpha isoform X2 [Oppia nitens]|uniref:probable phosphorylase b kinase regulatory subunit alpha isoform X2 n=1 Tax=Oppia nitens TaxID=1686743 RepID=UPI0023DC5CF1|nr:probable phosphorylase b kinase regulatory subunit alpha isoform X2 [Oppia nitens]